MTETFSGRNDSATKERLAALSKRRDEWQLEEIQAAMEELDAEQMVGHEKVTAWLKSWGTAKEKKAPR
jgi:predicted transcriptional regulator